MTRDKTRGIAYASVMIAIMFAIGAHYSMHSASLPAESAAPQNSRTGLTQSAPGASSERTVPAENHSVEQAVSSEITKEKTESTPVSSSQASKTEHAGREYYDVPLSNDLQDYLFAECASKKVPVDLVLALIDVESDFNPNLISKTDDYGLMQINSCHKDFLQKALHITDLLDEKQNIKAGVYMLSGIVNRYKDVNQALMVYNRGEAGAKKLWDNGVYSTTYSRNVIAKIDEIKRLI